MRAEAVKDEELLRWAEAAKREKARRHLLNFTQYIAAWYRAGWFHKVICSELERFFDSVQRKESPRLLIVSPPQHGKSTLVSQMFPAWALGRKPEQNIISVSYAYDRASFNSLQVQQIIEGERYQELWLGRELGMHRAEAWNLKVSDRFLYRASGVLGGITGMGAHMMILDDLLKNWEEATSPIRLEKVWDEIAASIKSRLAEGAGILYITTRWNEQDPAGRFLDAATKGGFPWRYLHFPQLAIEEGKKREAIGDFRKVGEALCPAMFSREYSEKVEADYKASGKYIVWMTANQGLPQPTVGRCYFHSEGDVPEDLAIRQAEEKLKDPQRCRLEIIVPRKEYKLEPEESGQWRIWERPIEGFCYGAGIDLSEGIDRGDGVTDEHCIRVWRRGILDEVIKYLHLSPNVSIGEVHKPCLVASYRSRADMLDLAQQLVAAHYYYNHFCMSVERNGPGISLIDTYLILEVEIHLILGTPTLAALNDKQGAKLGMRLGPQNKPKMLDSLKAKIRQAKYYNPDGEFWSQARHFVNIDGKLRGETRWLDDVVLAEAHASYCQDEAPMEWPGNLKKAARKRVEVVEGDETTGY